MLAVDVLIGADQPALEDRKEPFEGVGVDIAARPIQIWNGPRFRAERRADTYSVAPCR